MTWRKLWGLACFNWTSALDCISRHEKDLKRAIHGVRHHLGCAIGHGIHHSLFASRRLIRADLQPHPPLELGEERVGDFFSIMSARDMSPKPPPRNLGRGVRLFVEKSQRATLCRTPARSALQIHPATGACTSASQ